MKNKNTKKQAGANSPRKNAAKQFQDNSCSPVCDCCRAELASQGEKLFDLHVKGRADITRLKKRLLRQGGNRFQRNDVLDSELSRNIVRRLFEEGRFFPGQGASMLQMIPSECHRNVLLLAVHEKFQWWTGFALSDDGIWRLHSWGNDRGRVIETTEPSELYFGVRVGPAYYAEKVANEHFEFIQQAKRHAKGKFHGFPVG